MSKHRRAPPTKSRADARHRARRRPASQPAPYLVLGIAAVLTTSFVGGLTAYLQAREVAEPTHPASGPATPPRVAPDSAPPRTASSTASSSQRLGAEEAGRQPTDRERNRRQPAEPVPETSSGTFRVAPAPRGVGGEGATTYRVEVEQGLPYAPTQVARFVEQTLSEPRGWAATGEHRLARVEHNADIRILIATPTTTDELCAPLDTGGRLSCRNGANVVINAWRWHNGAPAYRGDLANYRRYVINHETGHALGYSHVECAEPGQPAPVMLQQTKGLDGCLPNPWPGRVDLVSVDH